MRRPEKVPDLFLHRAHDRADDGGQDGAAAGAADDVLYVERVAQSARCCRSRRRIDRATAEQTAENGRAADAADGASEDFGKLTQCRLFQRRADGLTADNTCNHLNDDRNERVRIHVPSPSIAASLLVPTPS